MLDICIVQCERYTNGAQWHILFVSFWICQTTILFLKCKFMLMFCLVMPNICMSVKITCKITVCCWHTPRDIFADVTTNEIVNRYDGLFWIQVMLGCISLQEFTAICLFCSLWYRNGAKNWTIEKMTLRRVDKER